MGSLHIDPSKEALALMHALGVPLAASAIYLHLLRTGILPLCKAAEAMEMSPATVSQAVDYLKLFRLVSQDIAFGKAVLYASDPRNAWKAHDAEFYWMRSLHIGDLEVLPPLPAMADEERRRRYARLEVLCGPIYDRTAKAHDPLRHKHRDIESSSLFSSWLAAVIASAKRNIVAVEKPPRLPDLAPIWVALTRRIRAGASYTRIVGIDEIVEHGLDIVSRDLNEYSIDLRLSPPPQIEDAFYIIDNSHLLVKNIRGIMRDGREPHFGVYTSNRQIVRRYIDMFRTHYLPISKRAAPVVARLRAYADDVRRNLLAEGHEQEAAAYHDIVRFGKFAPQNPERQQYHNRLIIAGYATRNTSGYLVMTVKNGLDDID